MVPANIRKQKYPYYHHLRQQCHPLRRCLRYAHRHRLWARAASVPTPLCRACHSVHAGGCDQGVSWMVLASYMQAGVIRVYPGWFWRWPVAALRLRLGAYASAACETARSVAVEPWRWNPDCAGSCCAVALGHASRKRLCVHVLGLRACVLARCAYACNAHAVAANCRQPTAALLPWATKRYTARIC